MTFNFNLSTLESASRLGIEAADDLDSIEGESFDIEIFYNVLEHNSAQHEELFRLPRKLKKWKASH